MNVDRGLGIRGGVNPKRLRVDYHFGGNRKINDSWKSPEVSGTGQCYIIIRTVEVELRLGIIAFRQVRIPQVAQQEPSHMCAIRTAVGSGRPYALQVEERGLDLDFIPGELDACAPM